jgi:hypothetical protein
MLSSRVGPNVGGLVSEEEKVEQEVPGGPQATSFEEPNPEKVSPDAYSAYRSNMTCLL